MTTIVGLVSGKNVYIGGDRAATDKTLRRILIKDPKVWMGGNVAFGVCGLPKVIDAIKCSKEIPSYPGVVDTKTWVVNELVPAIRNVMTKLEAVEDHNGAKVFNGQFLIGVNGKLFQIQSNFQLVEALDGYDSIGSGSQFALGALTNSIGFPKMRIVKALKVSALHNAGVSGPFDVVVAKRVSK